MKRIRATIIEPLSVCWALRNLPRLGQELESEIRQGKETGLATETWASPVSTCRLWSQQRGRWGPGGERTESRQAVLRDPSPPLLGGG